jgi:membrane protease YdiL (CAAX protease family)
VVAAVCSGLVFAWAHGQQDPWLFLDRLVFGLVASWLVWRTGGLEASIALHGANNLLAFGLGVLSGQVEATMTTTGADATMVAVDVLMMVLSAAVLDRLARRYAMARCFRPPARAW